MLKLFQKTKYNSLIYNKYIVISRRLRFRGRWLEPQFERELIRERTMAGLAAARARGRQGGRKFQLTKAQVRLAQSAMKKRDSTVSELCEELGVTRQTLYRYVGPDGKLREYGNRVLGK